VAMQVSAEDEALERRICELEKTMAKAAEKTDPGATPAVHREDGKPEHTECTEDSGASAKNPDPEPSATKVTDTSVGTRAATTPPPTEPSTESRNAADTETEPVPGTEAGTSGRAGTHEPTGAVPRPAERRWMS